MGRKLLLVILIAASASLSFAQRKIKIACVGNSITYGSGIQNREKLSYPAQLQMWLGNDYEVKNFGVSGATMLKNGDRPYWNEPEFEGVKNYLPDIIIIKLGTNDSKPQNWKFSDEFKKDYELMITEFSKLSSRPRIMLAKPVPVFTEEKWGINQAIVRDEIVPSVAEIGLKHQLDVIDLYTPLLNAGRFFPDQVHPDPIGAELMVKEIYVKLFHKNSENRGKAFNTATFPVPSPEYRGAAAGWGDQKDWYSQHEDINAIGDSLKVDLVFLGNSITQSWGGQGRHVGSPVKELWDSLYAPRNAANFGISGDRTQHILWRINNGNFDGISPKVIVLTIGVNNFPHNTANEISAGIKLIVKELTKVLPKTHIILLGPLPTGANNGDERRLKYHEIHKQIRSLDLLPKVHYLKVESPFILETGEMNYELMRKDNIHLAVKGYYEWARQIEDLINEFM